MKEILANYNEAEDKQISVDEYRKNKHRCRTCIYSKDLDYQSWVCEAKNKRNYGGVKDTIFAGMFCGLYRPNNYDSK